MTDHTVKEIIIIWDPHDGHSALNSNQILTVGLLRAFKDETSDSVNARLQVPGHWGGANDADAD